MKKSLINQYSDEEFISIVLKSNSLKDVAKKLGYTANSGDLANTIKGRIKKLDVSIDHFYKKENVVRNEENIFIRNSTADQSTLRRWYLKKNVEYRCVICGLENVWQGKPLSLILDHINGINNDDRLENLRWVCPNCNQQLDTTGGKNIKRYVKKHYCLECGKEISKNAKMCQSCSSKKNNKRKVFERPSREELKTLLWNSSFVEVGKKYGVSDNAIRKWCIFYNLPNKTSEIKKMSEEKWKLI